MKLLVEPLSGDCDAWSGLNCTCLVGEELEKVGLGYIPREEERASKHCKELTRQLCPKLLESLVLNILLPVDTTRQQDTTMTVLREPKQLDSSRQEQCLFRSATSQFHLLSACTCSSTIMHLQVPHPPTLLSWTLFPRTLHPRTPRPPRHPGPRHNLHRNRGLCRCRCW